MSQWTHVNASIRFDSILGHGAPTEAELGKMCLYEDDDMSHWEEPDLPCGSEGSLEYRIIKGDYENSMASHVVSIWGDLRDYEDEGEIVEYFTKIVDGKMIRSGILEISIELQFVSVYRYDSDALEWKMISKVETE